jgi:hypothetical protein
MRWDDYWAVKYLLKETGSKRHYLYICAPYDQYDKDKIKKIISETDPEWEILEVYPIQKPKFKKPDGG